MSNFNKPVSSGDVLAALAGTALDSGSTSGTSVDYTEVVNHPIPTSDDKDLAVGGDTAGDEDASGLTITNTPIGYTRVLVDGVGANLGDAVKTKDCYFSADGGTTARAISAIVATDELIWNGVIAGANLLTTNRVDFDYMAV